MKTKNNTNPHWKQSMFSCYNLFCCLHWELVLVVYTLAEGHHLLPHQNLLPLLCQSLLHSLKNKIYFIIKLEWLQCP